MVPAHSHDPARFAAPLGEQFSTFIEEHRAAMRGCLDGLSDDEARERRVPSATTLLGLVKHVTFVEQVWYDEAITGRTREEIGCAADPDESFVLDPADTIETVQAAYDEACDASRARLATLAVDDVVGGNRRGPLPLRWIHLHVLRELAQHCGHADILREQVLSARG